MAAFTRCLITGATGFVGSHLARRLVAEGNDVHILTRATSSLAAIQDVAERLTIHRLGPTTDCAAQEATRQIATTIAKANPDVVFHLAAMFRAEHTPEDIAPMIEANINFTTQLLEGMKLTGAKTIINTGTSWQHFSQHFAQHHAQHSHGADYDPVCLYGATKQAAEDITTFYCNAHGFRAITLKLFDTYGPGDTRNKLLNIFKSASESEIPIAFSKGEQLIDLVHIDDVVNAYIAAASHALQSDVGKHDKYGVSSGSPLPLRELAARYEAIIGRRLNIAWGERPYRAREVMQTPKLPGLPGWAPAITFDAGLSELINTSDAQRHIQTTRTVAKVTHD